MEFVDELYAGLREEAGRFGVEIVGGNMAKSRLGIFVDVFLLGEAKHDDVLLRSRARVGDAVLVTGSLGDAAAGVELLLNPQAGTTPAYAAIAAERRDGPHARIREGRSIAGAHIATAMIDVSDGLAADLNHICRQSNVSARLFADRLPVREENRSLAKETHGDEWHFALHGGEDYELLFTAPREKARDLMSAVARTSGTPARIIGEILPADRPPELVLPDGAVVPLVPAGWDHFRR